MTSASPPRFRAGALAFEEAGARSVNATRALTTAVLVFPAVCRSFGAEPLPLPEATCAWECVPGVIRSDGFEAFRVEVQCADAVSAVIVTKVSPRLVPPLGAPFALRDDGLDGDATAGDHVYTSGPFRYNTAVPMPSHYMADPNSPAGLDAFAVGEIEVVAGDRTRGALLTGPRLGVLRADLPPTWVKSLSDDVVVSGHLINLRTAGRQTHRVLRGLAGDLRPATRLVYAVFPDMFDFLTFLSTGAMERLPRTSLANYEVGKHITVKVDYTGTGLAPMDDTAAYGSRGRLLGINILGPADRGLVSRAVVHEILHQWSAYADASLGLADSEGHYPGRSSAASLLGGFLWSQGDGGAILDCSQGANGATRASPLDLYMMGVVEASRVRPIWVYSSGSPLPLARCGQPLTDVFRTVTMADIQTVHGVRTPGPAAARRFFRVGFVVESHRRFLTESEMTYYEIMAAHFGKTVPEGEPDPYVGANWVPVQRYFGEGTAWTTALWARHDFDRDGDVDVGDFAVFQACFNGSGRPPGPGRLCEQADADGDSDVDIEDLSAFQACFNGAGQPPACP